MKLAAIASLLATSLLTGCVTDSSKDDDDDTDTDTDPQPDSDPQPNPDPQPDPQPVAPVAAGTYNVRSELDLTVEALLPERIHAMVITLRAFSQNPAQTLFDVAEDAGVPAVEEIRDNLPDYVEDKVEGWINDEIAKVTIDGVSVTQHAANIVTLAETSVGKFALDSTLVVDTTTATHALTTLDLSPAGLAATFPLAALPNMSATATCSSTDGIFTMGAHGYAIPYGEYVWQALNAKIDLRGSLGAAVNCPAIAATVSDKCVWGACVGHETELAEICERGLDEIVERVHDEFTAMTIDLLQLESGTATLSADARSMTGTWAAQVNAGQGLRTVPATFTASK